MNVLGKETQSFKEVYDSGRKTHAQTEKSQREVQQQRIIT